MRFPVIFGSPDERKDIFERSARKVALLMKNSRITPNQITIFRQFLL